jgi:hypothetical protein
MSDVTSIVGAITTALFAFSMTIFFWTTWPVLKKEYPLGRGGVPVFGQLGRYRDICIRDGVSLRWWQIQVVLNWAFLLCLVGLVVLHISGLKDKMVLS